MWKTTVGRRVPSWCLGCLTAGSLTILVPLAFDGAAQLPVCIAPDVVGKRLNVPRRGGEFKDARNDEKEVSRRIDSWREDWELLNIEEVHIHSSDLLPCNIVEGQGAKISHESCK